MRSGQLIAKNDYLIEEIIKDPLYEIREDGTIYSRVAKTGKVFVDPKKWREVGRFKKDKWVIKYHYKELIISRVIYRKFAGPLAPDLVIFHLDNNIDNNHVDNLALGSKSVNNKNIYKEGNRIPHIGNRRITFELARCVREDYATGNFRYVDLMEKYGLTSKSTISYIIKGKIWTDELKQLHEESIRKS